MRSFNTCLRQGGFYFISKKLILLPFHHFSRQRIRRIKEGNRISWLDERQLFADCDRSGIYGVVPGEHKVVEGIAGDHNIFDVAYGPTHLFRPDGGFRLRLFQVQRFPVSPLRLVNSSTCSYDLVLFHVNESVHLHQSRLVF